MTPPFFCNQLIFAGKHTDIILIQYTEAAQGINPLALELDN